MASAVHAPQVFEFFADPRNLEQLHPAWARPRWLTPPPARLAAGAVLDFRAAWLPGRWRVIVREFDAPYRFVDAQVNGPFARWEHRHRFTDGAEGEGGTWVEDRVTYRLPLGPLGRLAHGLGAGASRARRSSSTATAAFARCSAVLTRRRPSVPVRSERGLRPRLLLWGEVRQGA